MPRKEFTIVDWDRTLPQPSADALLLRELQHRVANELCASIAAMQIARAAGMSGPRMELFDQAIERLEGFGQVHTVLSGRTAQSVDLEQEMHRLCRGLIRGREGLDHSRVSLTVDRDQEIPGPVAQRLLLVGSELIFNAIRHALTRREGLLDITASVAGDDVILEVSDNGPGIRDHAETQGTGLGTHIVQGLVRAGDGRLECRSDRSGTTIRVVLPLEGPSPVEWRQGEAA